MTAEEIKRRIAEQIGDKRNEPHAHGVILDKSLIGPEQIKLIDRSGQTDRVVEAWLVLIENPNGTTDDEKGYRIVAKLDGSIFGLASAGFPQDDHLVCIGWYGDFMQTLECM